MLEHLSVHLSIHVYLSIATKYIVLSMHITLNITSTQVRQWKQKAKRNMISGHLAFATVEIWSTLDSLQCEKLSRHQAEQQNKCSLVQVDFWKWQNNRKERYGSGCNIRNRFGGFQITFSLNHIWQGCSEQGHQSRYCYKAPTIWETYEGILSLIFPPSSTFHLHKSTQTIIFNHEYKL